MKETIVTAFLDDLIMDIPVQNSKDSKNMKTLKVLFESKKILVT